MRISDWSSDVCFSDLPVDVLEDRAFARFLDLYPIDGPPIIGQARMDEHMARLDKIDPARLAAAFRELARQTNLSAVKCVRNKHIEPRARATDGNKDALGQGREGDHEAETQTYGSASAGEEQGD